MAIGLSTGALVGAMTWFALAGRQEPSVSEHYPEAVKEAGAYNVISALLVDIRAWDTMGEISVLVAAAAGVAGGQIELRRAAKSRRALTIYNFLRALPCAITGHLCSSSG
jgi:multicomponent Na+:H+ antiporter subunit A